jgi:hypothetical protein
MDRMRDCVGLRCNNGIRDRGQKQQLHGNRRIEGVCGKLPLHFGNKKASKGIYCKTTGLKILKRAVGISSGLRRIINQTLWRDRPPPKRKKNLFTTSVYMELEMWEHWQMDYGEATGLTDNL